MARSVERTERRYSWRQGVQDGRAMRAETASPETVRHGARTIARHETDDRGRRAYFLGFARGVSE